MRLKAAVIALKTSGRLIYAIGSMTNEETDQMADRLAREYPQLVPQEFSDPRTGELGPPRLAMWPDHDWGEAVFIAKWTKSVAKTDVKSE